MFHSTPTILKPEKYATVCLTLKIVPIFGVSLQQQATSGNQSSDKILKNNI